MAFRHSGTARSRLAPIPLLLAAMFLAGCGGSSGVHTQSGSSSTPTSSLSTSASSPTDPTSSGQAPSPSFTQPNYGGAQPAVDAYTKAFDAYNKAFRDPAHASPVTFDKYLSGQAKIDFDSSLAQAKAQGIAYRGTPATPRLRVVSSSLSASLPEVVLHDCGLVSKSDPFIGYNVKTGKPLPTQTPRIPPPFAKTIKMFQPNRKQWVITSVATDTTKTCAP